MNIIKTKSLIELPTQDEVQSYISTNCQDFVFKEIVFDKESDAIEFVSSLSEYKPYTVFAVRCKVFNSDFSKTEAGMEILNSIKKYDDKILNFPSYLLEKFQEQTSSKRTCKVCTSSISKEHMIEKIKNSPVVDTAAVSCPVCGDSSFLISKSEQKSLDSWKIKRDSLKDKYALEEAKYLKKSGAEYMVVYASNQCAISVHNSLRPLSFEAATQTSQIEENQPINEKEELKEEFNVERKDNGDLNDYDNTLTTNEHENIHIGNEPLNTIDPNIALNEDNSNENLKNQIPEHTTNAIQEPKVEEVSDESEENEDGYFEPSF